MTADQMTIANFILACLAFIVSIAALLRSFATDRFNKRMSKSVFEKELLNKINYARTNYAAKYDQIVSLADIEESQKELYRLALEERIEEYLNALEYACDKYNDGILDKASFKRNFVKLVTEAYNNKNIFNNIVNGDTNRFVQLKKVIQDLSKTQD